MAVWMAGGRQIRRSISAEPRPAGGGTCASRSAKPARPPSRKRCTHLRPVWRLIPVGVQTRHVVEAPDRQSSMRFLRSSIGPGVHPMHLGSVNDQLGSYTRGALAGIRPLLAGSDGTPARPRPKTFPMELLKVLNRVHKLRRRTVWRSRDGVGRASARCFALA